jgi:hypothetical protein
MANAGNPPPARKRPMAAITPLSDSRCNFSSSGPTPQRTCQTSASHSQFAK